jgi:transposase-like protein
MAASHRTLTTLPTGCPPTPSAPRDANARASSAGSRPRRYTDDERRRALAVLGECGGHLTKASARLGIAVPLLSKWRTEAIRASKAGQAG